MPTVMPSRWAQSLHRIRLPLARTVMRVSCVVGVALGVTLGARTVEERVLAAAERWGAKAGGWLADNQRSMVDPAPASAEVKLTAPDTSVRSEVPTTRTTQKRVGDRRAVAKQHDEGAAVWVSARRVLSLAERGARPHGRYVPSGRQSPAGLRLSSVDSLGIGLADGDILTHVAGQSVSSPGDVIGTVLELRGRRQATISGAIWRRGRTLSITVEQPYLESEFVRD